MNTTSINSKSSVYYSCFALLFILLAISFSNFDFSETFMRERIRIAARIAFFYWILAFWAGPLWKVWRNDTVKFIFRTRRQIGVSAAVAQTVFITLVAWTISEMPRPFEEVVPFNELMIGASGMVTYWVLALTSNNISIKLLGKWWKRMHTVGVYYLGYSYILEFTPGLGENPAYYFPLALILGCFALRVFLVGKRLMGNVRF